MQLNLMKVKGDVYIREDSIIEILKELDVKECYIKQFKESLKKTKYK